QNFTPDAISNFTVFDSLGTEWNFTLQWQQVANTPAEAALWSWTMWYTPAGSQPDANANWNGPNGPEAGAFVGDSSGFTLTGADSLIASEHRGITAANPNGGAVYFNADGSLEDNGAIDPLTG